MKKSKKTIVLIACIAAILTFDGIIPSYANSAQANWSGVDGNGLMIKDGDCPIEVEKEVLTLDLPEFPKNYYDNIEDFLSYTGKVSAEYTFYNPSDYAVTATLLFPFGKQPDYANGYDEKTETWISDADTAKYDISVGGKAVAKNVRYTLSSEYAFNVDDELFKVRDDYLKDEFYSPTTTVTEYAYIVGGNDKEGLIDESKYRAANVAFDFDGGDGKTKIYFPEQSGFSLQKDGDGRFSKWANNGDVFSVYAIGKPLSAAPKFTCYKNGGVQDKEEINGLVSLTSTKTYTFKDFVFQNYEESFGVSKVDWYNAVVCAFNQGVKANEKLNFIFEDYGFGISCKRFAEKLMRWYEYEIIVDAKETIVNKVVAPIYPDIDLSYTPAVYGYTYLLSPAKTWKSFSNLNVVINTPYYISNCSFEGFSKTQTGYELFLNELPESELTFNLSTSEPPVLKQHFTSNRKGCSLFD